MPEVRFRVRWPDGVEEDCYSPSTVIGEYLAPGESYALEDFLARTRSALQRASARVEERYGFACSNALDQLARIERHAAALSNPAAVVACLSLTQGPAP